MALIDNYWQGPDFTSSFEKFAPEGAIRVNSVPNKCVFTVEGSGALPIKDSFKVAIDVFLEKLDEFDDQLKNLKIEQEVKKITAR